MSTIRPPETSASYPSLRGRRVFVTGGGSGIGESLVAAFAMQGASVAFVDIDAASSYALSERLKASDLSVWWRECDVADVSSLRSCLDAADGDLGHFHVLVNNVANDARHDLASVDVSYWERSIAVNQRAAFFSIQAVVPGMKELGGGSIINIGSTGWQNKAGGYPGYAMAKSSMNGLTRGLARELGTHHIRINTVSPGWVMTEKQIRLWLTPEGEQDIARHQVLPDYLQPDDIAAMVLFLASDDSRMCSAQEFIVDGGWT